MILSILLEAATEYGATLGIGYGVAALGAGVAALGAGLGIGKIQCLLSPASGFDSRRRLVLRLRFLETT